VALLLGAAGIRADEIAPDPAAAAAQEAARVERTLAAAPGLLAFRPQLPARLPLLFPALGGGSFLAPFESRFGAEIFYSSTLQYTRGVIASERPDPTLDDVLAYMDAVYAATGKTLFYYDGETARLDLGWRMGLPGGWEVGLDLPLIRHSGGWADEPVSQFHRLLGVSDAGRDSAPRGAAAAVFLSSDGSYRLTGDDFPSAALGDIAVRARVRLPSPGPAFAADLTLAIELPTGDPDLLAGSGGVDASAGLTFAWRHARSRWTAGLGYSALGGLESLPDVDLSDVWAATAAYEVRLGSRAAFIAQLLHGTSPFLSIRKDGISDPAGLLGAGVRLAAGGGWSVDLALVEDFYRHNTDLDIGLLLGASWTP